MDNRARVLMCPPAFYAVDYVINPWMEGNVGRPDRANAVAQWERLKTLVERHCDVELLEPADGLPDMPFVANAGLVCGDVFVPSRFRFPQRAGELERIVPWFRDHGRQVVELDEAGSFEGEGDALFHPGEAWLWGGYGVRSSLQIYRALDRVIDAEVVPLRLVDGRFYHLDTCFCPLHDGRAMYFPDAFDQESVAEIRSRIPAEKRIEVGPEDALNFACNAVVFERNLVSNFASPALRRKLEAWGYTVETTALAEFILAGGAAKCLVLKLDNAPPESAGETRPPGVSDRRVEIRGQLLDTGLMNDLLDCITEGGGSFEIEDFEAGLRHDQDSHAAIRVVAPTPARLDTIVGRLLQLGARAAEEERDAGLETVAADGVAPAAFYSTTIFPTEIRIDGDWRRVAGQRMDAVVVVEAGGGECRLLRDLRAGDRVVCGVDGIRVHAGKVDTTRECFEFMGSGVSSERRVELAIESVAREMCQIKKRGGKIVVVAGPVVVHTGGGPYLARLIHLGYVQALLGGNAIAVHDIEQNRYGTSLGVDLKRGTNVHGGHRHHLLAINEIRRCGGIAQAVAAGVVSGGVFYECVKHEVPFSLAGSIRDDGPLPETKMDLLEAQADYARLVEGADLVLMLASMLHSIGVGNMTPAGVRLICVDISPAVATKLADRGSVESTSVVTDVGLFLNLLARRLEEAG